MAITKYRILRLCSSLLVVIVIALCLYSVSIAPYRHPDIYIGPLFPAFGYPKPYPSLSVKDEMNIGASGAVSVHRIIRYDPPSILLEYNLTDFFDETTLTLFKVRSRSENIIVDRVIVNGTQIELSDLEIITDNVYTRGSIEINPNRPYTVELDFHVPYPTKEIICTRAFPFSQSVIAVYIEPPLIYNSEDAIRKIEHGDNIYKKAWEKIYSTNISYLSFPWYGHIHDYFIIVDFKRYYASIDLPKEYIIRPDAEGTVYVDWMYNDVGYEYYNVTKITGKPILSINEIIRDPRIPSGIKRSIVHRFLDNNIINATVMQLDSHVEIRSPPIRGLIKQIIIWMWIVQGSILKYIFMVLLFLGICIPGVYGYKSLGKLLEGWTFLL